MGRTYPIAAAVIGAGLMLAANAVAAPAVTAVSSGYAVPEAAVKDGRSSAVETCFARVQDRLTGKGADSVTLGSVNRAWPGSEGWIVDLTVEIARGARSPRLRDYTCREGRHGLHLARY
ncbi:hypothetical protein [Parvularcula dongshanensis]|uniref:Uncharacterized protein n=1 Tax=Parvularcula dongshanensis TaxID=1173995 RepID=A0A840I193_9PROT|nr:hypothetical protein [Parvularcula dongshanensis]MBB4658816.1 hypothetical protein [Parvularcula dongshanensis]